MVNAKLRKPGNAAAFPVDLCARSKGTRTGAKPGGANPGAGYKSRIRALEAEIKLLTSYCSDTVYRLRYDDMRYDYISPAVKNLLGFTPEEIKRIHFRSLIVETKIVNNGLQKIDSFRQLEELRKQGSIGKWQADYLIRTRDGNRIWVSDISYPWYDDSGKVIGSVGSLRDITDRVEAEERMQEEISRMANVDALTGAASRGEFFRELDNELKRINRSEEDVAVLLVDIDRFKHINDKYGEEIGDMLLVEVAKIIRSCLRDTDLLTRLDGEEFGVILHQSGEQGAFWVGERIRNSISNREFMIGQDDKPVSCSVSIGVASAAPGENADASELYKTANTRLYIAKNTGHNQVSVDEVLHTH